MTSPYWQLVGSLIERGVATKEAWYNSDPAEFLQVKRKQRKGFSVRGVLKNVRKHMCWSKTLADYAIGAWVSCQIENNVFFRLLYHNGYDPLRVGTILCRWAGGCSVRNTMWVSGRIETGASLFAHAIMLLAPIVGYVDCKDPADPFKECGQVLLYWWTGGYVRSSCIELVRHVLKGDPVLSQSPEEEIMRTPVLISTNCNMTKVYVTGGTYSDDYSWELHQCMYRIHFSKEASWVDGVTCAAAKEFFTWAYHNPVAVGDGHDLHFI